MSGRKCDIVVIGGSSGSIPVLIKILKAIPLAFNATIVIVVHRLKNVHSDLRNILSDKHIITEPEDKEPVMPGRIYLAPQNYHLLFEQDNTFSMDYSETVNFSRPSIDVTFTSAAEMYGDNTTGILLSGANRDGADGMASIIAHGGKGIVQDPISAEYPSMPSAALETAANIQVLTPSGIINLLLSNIIA